jgi:hypothetical protein
MALGFNCLLQLLPANSELVGVRVKPCANLEAISITIWDL